jgi:hypothetical protein
VEVVVALSRKRKKELAHLRKNADTLLKEQREILEQAGAVVRDASRQAGNYAREQVAPRVRDTYDTRVHPAVDKSIEITRSAAHSARERMTDDVLPSVGAAIGSALAAIDVTRKPEVRHAVAAAAKGVEKTKKAVAKGAVGKKATELAVATGLKKKSSGPGKYILIGLGIVAVAGIAYAAWQTLRADDDLWIDDEVDQADVETPTEPATPEI